MIRRLMSHHMNRDIIADSFSFMFGRAFKNLSSQNASINACPPINSFFDTTLTAIFQPSL